MNSPPESEFPASNLIVPSNIFPVQTDEKDTWDKEYGRFVKKRYAPKDLNGDYYQLIEDLRQFRTADDSCAWLRQHGLGENRPWAKVRIDGQLVEVCKCDRSDCPLFSECRQDLSNR